MRLRFLGTGTALSKSRGWSSFLINDTILVDPPPDATHSLRVLKIEPISIESVIISHFHADHYFGMPFLILELFYFRPSNSPKVQVLAPIGAKEKIKSLMRLAYEDVVRDNPEIMDILDFIEILPLSEIEINSIKITPYPVLHNNIEAYGFRFQFNDLIMSFTGDTGMCAQLYEIVKDSDVLLSEMSNIDRESPYHLNLEEVRKLAGFLRLSKLKRVIATHLRDITPDAKDIQFAQDFETIELEDI